MIILSWIVFSIVAGCVGNRRKVGFGWAFFWSLLLSPIIGLIIAFASDKRFDIELNETALFTHNQFINKMKYLICLLLATFSLCSCHKSDEDRAKEIIKQYLKENLNDWNSYESVSFSSLDSAFSIMEIDPDIIIAEKALQSINRSFSISTLLLNEWKEDTIRYAKAYQEELSNWRILNDSVLHYKSIVTDLKSNYRPQLEGFIITHKYRASNDYGSKHLHESIFYIDTLFTNVIDVKEKLSN